MSTSARTNSLLPEKHRDQLESKSVTLACAGNRGGYIRWASGSMLKPHVLHNLCLQMSRNILKIPTSLIHASKTHAFISSPCARRHGHVFLPFGVILTKYASVSQLNKSICSNICPGPPSVNTKACIFVRWQMSTTWRFPKTSPNPANSDNDKQAPPLLAQSTHGPGF